MDKPEPATMVATRVVPVGDAEAFDRWAGAMTRSAADAAGSGGGVRLEQAGGLVHLVHRFDDEAALAAWTGSKDYRALLAEGERFPVERRTVATGRVARVAVPAESAASKLKTAILTWVTVFPVLLVVSTTVRALVGSWPQPLQLLLSSVVMVAALSWVIQPWVQRRARPWTLADGHGRARR